MNRQTFLAKNNEVPRQWVIVDATDQVLGRLSSKLAMVLMGKNKPTYTPHHDVGDFVVVINADKMRLTGNKPSIKFFQTYSSYPSGRRTSATSGCWPQARTAAGTCGPADDAQE